MRQKIANYLLLLVVFLLPFQTQWILSESVINGGVSEYGKLSIYAVEFLIVVVLLLRGRVRLVFGSEKIVRRLYFIFAVCFFSLTTSFVFNISLFQIGHVLIAGIAFMVLLDERTEIKKVLYAFLFGLVLPSVLGWYQFIVGGNGASTLFGVAEKQVVTQGVAVVETQAGRSLRAYGTFSHPNIFGGYLAIGILFLGWLVKFIKDKRQIILAGALTVLFSSTLILTFSRSAWLALTVSLFVVILQMLFYKKIPPKKAYSIIALGVLTIVLSVMVLFPKVFSRFQPSLRVEAISIEERFSQYDYIDEMVTLQPLFGVGPGNYVFALTIFLIEKPVWEYQPIHNSILLMISEIGFLGFIIVLYFFQALYRQFKKVYKKPAGIFFVCFSFAFLILAAFDHYLWSSWSGLALMAVSTAFITRIVLNRDS